jgi:C1A family cysteine protease
VLPKSGLIETAIATSIDWETKLSMASKIPDQGQCGSCWAVATVSMLQARFEAYTNKSRTFSAQQLINCAPNEQACGGTGGCDGSTVELAMEYMAAAGLKDSSSGGEPYFAKDKHCNEPMPTSSSSLRVGSESGLVGWEKLPENKIAPLMEALQRGPVAISLAATSEWNHYHSGVFDSCDKDAVVSHAVVLFGYGTDPATGANYWSVRNSWGKDWGEDGYIRMLKQDTPAKDEAYCGWDNDPGLGTACKPYPEKVYVCGMCGMLYDSVEAHFSPDAPALIATDGDGTGTFNPNPPFYY